MPEARTGLGYTRGTGAGLDHERALGLLLIVVSACSFGSGPFFARPVYESGLDWVTLMAWRFVLGAGLSLGWLLLHEPARRALRELSGRRLAVLIALGALYVGNSGTYFAGLETVSASLAALLVYIYPVLVAVLSIRWARRLQGRRAWFALGLATAGVALAVGGIDPSVRPPLAGVLLVLASPFIYAVWIVLSARLGGERGEREHATDVGDGDRDEAPETTEAAPAVAVMLTATAALYLVMAIVLGKPLTPDRIPGSAWIGLIGIGVVTTAIAVQTFYAGTRRLGAAQAALVSTVEPIYTITIATLLFGERLTPIQLVGGAMVIVAVIIVQLVPRSRRGTVRATAGAEGVT